jgi:hypothetical protein
MGVSSVTIRQQTRGIGRRFPEQFQNIYNARFVKLSTKYFQKRAGPDNIYKVSRGERVFRERQM